QAVVPGGGLPGRCQRAGGARGDGAARSPGVISDQRYGRLAETMAAWALRLRGYRIVGRNVRVSGREVDLVARRGSLLVVCEVKARRTRRFGAPAEAVGERTQ